MSKKNKNELSQKQQIKMQRLLAEWGLEQSQLTEAQKKVISNYVIDSSKQTKSYILIIICAAAMAATAFLKVFETYHLLRRAFDEKVILYKIVTEEIDHVVDLNTFKYMVLQHFGAVSFATGFTVFAVAIICMLIITCLWSRQQKSTIHVLLDSIAEKSK
ncbi:hypothetical protein [Limihaloglobus sulfuriphilus]|nr:hypothetical protein [Limihaloglobus sulfuriphilus]